MNALNRFFAENSHFLSCLDNARKGEDCFLVGGALRDAVMGRQCADYDLITPGDPTSLARNFAGKVGGSWFSLDAERCHSRVVCNKPQGRLSFDFAPFRFPKLEDDLRDRDFTLNAMALPLHSLDGKIFDPLSGLSDLRHGFLRSCGENSFWNDPLRILRGVRLALQFELRIETHSFFLMKKAVDVLDRVAAERIKHELGLIFSLEAPSRAVFLMEDLGLNAEIWGKPLAQGSTARGSVWLEKGCAIMDLFDKSPVFRSRLEGLEEEGFSRASLLKLGLFLRGYDPGDFRPLLDRLRLARKSIRFLAEIQSLSERRFREWSKLKCGERGRALWVENLGRHPLELLLVLAVLKAQDAPRALLFVSQAAELFLRFSGGKRVPDLLQPRVLRQEGVDDKSLSKILKAIRREEIGARVRNRNEALAFVRRPIKRD